MLIGLHDFRCQAVHLLQTYAEKKGGGSVNRLGEKRGVEVIGVMAR
jgi:hypothetical protein